MTKRIVFGLFLLAVLYLSVAQCFWAFNNPKGNRSTFITHFWDAMQFKKCPEFQ